MNKTLSNFNNNKENKIMTLETKYDLDARVEIIEIGRTGSIVEISFDWKLRYHVRYFDNGCPQTVIFYEDEIREVKK